jgi:hypothetical protein
MRIECRNSDWGSRKMRERSARGLRFLARNAAQVGALAVLSVVVSAALTDNGWAQAKRGKPAEFTRVEKPANAPAPTVDPSSSFGQAMTACETTSNKSPESFTLPGLNGDISLDHCYRGRDYQICTFNAFLAEGKSLVDTYTKIIDAKYPELSSVDDVCKLGRDALSSAGAGAEDFSKRFSIIKSQYESHSKCTANVEQAFKDLELTALTQAPAVLKSMNDAMDGDLGNVSRMEDQLVDLAEKMQGALKAIRTVEKIHEAICAKTPAGASAAPAAGANDQKTN